MSVQNIRSSDLMGATLLSLEEVKVLPRNIKGIGKKWWLRSPGYSTVRAAGVDGNGYVYNAGYIVNFQKYGVRPALIFDPESKHFDGETLQFGSNTFDVICNGKYALCRDFVAMSYFGKDSNYDTSDVKRSVDMWYENEFENLKAKEGHNPIADWKEQRKAAVNKAKMVLQSAIKALDEISVIDEKYSYENDAETQAFDMKSYDEFFNEQSGLELE